MQPATMAGRTAFNFRDPCLIRKKHAVRAAGRKNIKLMIRAWSWGVFSTKVSQRISKLPPPTPRPARKPRTAPTARDIGTEFNIGIGSLPIRSGFQDPGEAISPGSFFRRFQQECRRQYRRQGMAMPCPMGSCCRRLQNIGRQGTPAK